jgi:hypothetical protein
LVEAIIDDRAAQDKGKGRNIAIPMQPTARHSRRRKQPAIMNLEFMPGSDLSR